MQKSAGAGVPPADDESVGLALGCGLFLPVFLGGQKAHGFAFFHIVGEVSPGKMEEEPAVTVRIGIIIMYELHPVFKKGPEESGAFLIIEIFAPAQVIDPGIFLFAESFLTMSFITAFTSFCSLSFSEAAACYVLYKMYHYILYISLGGYYSGCSS